MTRLIRKYKNRRLYDTEISQYITIEELQSYVIKGQLFRVIDTNQKDITAIVLLQIVVEMESGASQFLSEDMLRQLIIAGNHPMSQSLKKMFAQFFESFGQTLQGSQDYQKAASSWQKNMQNLFQNWQNPFK